MVIPGYDLSRYKSHKEGSNKKSVVAEGRAIQASSRRALSESQKKDLKLANRIIKRRTKRRTPVMVIRLRSIKEVTAERSGSKKTVALLFHQESLAGVSNCKSFTGAQNLR